MWITGERYGRPLLHVGVYTSLLVVSDDHLLVNNEQMWTATGKSKAEAGGNAARRLAGDLAIDIPAPPAPAPQAPAQAAGMEAGGSEAILAESPPTPAAATAVIP